MTDLAQRLIERASVHAWSVTSAETPEAIEAIAQHCVVDFLRELADEWTDKDGNWYVIIPPRLRELINSIEKGGQDNGR